MRIYTRRSITERFWEKVDTTGDCWLWTASKTEFGYGQFGTARGKPSTTAHRVSWELHFGPIPDGMFVCHHCDTPPCVKPDHLFLGTHEQNQLDMLLKGRQARG